MSKVDPRAKRFKADWSAVPFELAVKSHGSGSAGLPQKEWAKVGRYPVIGQGAEEIEGWTDRADLLLTPNPAVVLYGGHTRRVKHVSRPFVPGPNVKILQPEAELDSKFLYYFLSQLPIKSKGYADHFPLVRQFNVPVPPLEEQRSIVRMLDAAFDGLSIVKLNAEKTFQHARAVYDSHLSAVFTNRECAWPSELLGDVCDFKGGSQPPKSEFIHAEKPGYVRFLQIRDYSSDRNVTFIQESPKNRLCDSDDILIGRYGASVGKILTGQAGAYNVALMKAVPRQAKLTKLWLFYFLQSDAFQIPLGAVADRSAQAGFSRDDIYNFRIPMPSPAEQLSICVRLSHIQRRTSELAENYSKKLTALHALDSSVLAKVFTDKRAA